LGARYSACSPWKSISKQQMSSAALIDPEKGEASTEDGDCEECSTSGRLSISSDPCEDKETGDTNPTNADDTNSMRGNAAKLRSLVAILALVISSFSNSSQSVAIKMAGRAGCQALVAATGRFLIQTTISSWSLGGIITPAYDIWFIGGSRRFWIIMRCASGSLNFGVFSVVVTSMAVGEATMIKYASPAITCVLARFMLDERWGWSEGAALLACTCGVALVASAGADHSSTHHTGHLGYYWAITLGLFGSLCNAIRNISLKRLGRATETAGDKSSTTTALQADLMTWLTGVIGLVMCGTSALIVEGPGAFSTLGSPVCLLWVAAVGAAGYCTQWSINWGAQGGTAVLNSLISYLDVVFSLIWQVAVFQEPLLPKVVAGATLAFVSVALLTAQKACQH